MNSNVMWEPIQPGEPVDYDMTIGSNSELRVVTELGEMVVEFDDTVRLCRATPSPPWSQEPPTEPGDYFVGWYDGDEWIYNHVKVVWLRRNKRDSLNVIVRDGYKTVDNMADYIGFDVWWSTAHVPEPPVT